MSGPGSTLVSCIMPTRNRRHFVPAAIRAFLRQDYEHRELLIVDDGTEPVEDLVPDDPRMRYERVPRRMRLGAKRNLACRLAAGEVIAHWDDDDWSAPWRLTYQVTELLETGADVCGLNNIFFFDPRTGRAWRYVHPPKGSRPWVAGGTLCYTKSFWRGHSFAEINVGEDTRFVWDGRPKITTLQDPNFYIAMIHPRNTSPKRPPGNRWRRADAEAVTRLLADDPDGYLPQRAGRAASTAPSATPLTGEAVTVSIPYYGCKAYIRRAVESVLAQTHRNLVVVVVNDADPDPPWDELATIDDPRLVRFDLTANGGRYLADAIVLAASPSPYLLIHDADDWSEPDRVEKLLRRLVEQRADVAVSSIEVSRARSGIRRVGRPLLDAPLGPRVRHRVDHYALFRTDALVRVGGCYGGLRIGYDTLLMNLMLMTASVALVDEPLYHRVIRPGSLTTSSTTGFGSRERARAQQEVERRYRLAYEAFRKHADGGIGRAGLEESLCAIARREVSDTDDRRITREGERLRPLLAAAATSTKIEGVRSRIPTVHDLIREESLWSGAWSVRCSTAVEIAERLPARGSDRILEAGSGTTTLVFASHAAQVGGRVVSLEHEARFAK
ncbi:MAG: glycosyltransferase, partial [Actinomycetota bacterium]|nr:glycosyltransferase [Actinomycetota bacterium]